MTITYVICVLLITLLAPPLFAQDSKTSPPANEFKTVAIGSQQWMVALMSTPFEMASRFPRQRQMHNGEAAYKNKAAVWCFYNK